MKKILLFFFALLILSFQSFADDLFIRANSTTAKTGINLRYGVPISQIDIQNVSVSTASSLVFDIDNCLGYGIDFKISDISAGSVPTTASISYRSKTGAVYETVTVTSGSYTKNTKSAYIRITIPMLNTINITTTGNITFFQSNNIGYETIPSLTISVLNSPSANLTGITTSVIYAKDGTGLSVRDDSRSATSGWFLKDGGNVGFGTITPQRKFSVVGDAQVTGDVFVVGATRSTSGFAVRTNITDTNAAVSMTGVSGGAGKPGIAMGAGGGSVVDTTLYRNSADNLKTDDNLTVALGLNLGSATGASAGTIKASGGITVSGNIYSSASGYGGYYVSGNVTATNIVNTWTVVTVNAVSQALQNTTHTAGVITCTNAGTYWVTWVAHISSKTASDDLHFGVIVGGVLNPAAGTIIEPDESISTSDFLAGQGFVTITAGQTLALGVRNITSASRDCTIEYLNFIVRKMW